MWFGKNSEEWEYAPVVISSGRETDLSQEVERLRCMRELKHELEKHFSKILENFDE